MLKTVSSLSQSSFFLKDLQENEIAKEKNPLYSLVIMYAWCVDGYNATF